MGPLELSHGGEALDLGGTRQRVVLAMLALNANRVVPIEQLIDAVWDTSPPTTARAQIQICISALRRVVGNTGGTMAIHTRAPGYLLEVADTDLDTAQFAGLVASARAHVNADRLSEAVATLRSALGLWRGPALGGLHSERLRREAAQLADARLSAIMERIRLDLALGRHDEVIGELTALVDEHPLRERLYEFLMLALYRSGRQAEALELCRRARATLVEELGIELGQSVRRLETAILNRDPELDIPSAPVNHGVSHGPSSTAPAEPSVVPRRLPATIADFTGRQAQLDEIKRALSDDEETGSRYGTRIVAVSGKGGVGKSTLALRAAHELRDVYPDGHLYGDLGSPDGEDRVRPVLTRFLRALGVEGSALPDDVEERIDLYRSRTAGKKVLVVLDGASSEEQILPLLPGGPGCAVIATSRAPLSGLPGAHLQDVGVFDVDRSLELLAKIIGPTRLAAEQDAAAELVTLCGGLPLAIRIAGARLASRPHWRLDVLVARLRNSVRRLDELSYRGLVLRSNIGLSYQSLSPVARSLFRRFALITTPDFPAWTAAPLLDIDPFDAYEVVESLVEAQLLDTVQYPGEHLRYRFHDLIRVYATEQLREEPEEDRAGAVTRLLGAWLARAEHAHRKEYGGDYTTLHGTAARWERAAELEEIDEIGDQIEWLESERRSLVSAVHLAADYGMAEACWDLALSSVTLFEVKSYFDDWRETAERALATTEAAGNRRGRAAMLYSLGTMYLFHTRPVDAERCLSAALEIFEEEGDDHGYALVLRNAATADRMRNRAAEMRAKYEAALERMRRVGDLVGEAHILQSLAKVSIDEGDADRARGLLDTALERFQRVGYLRGEAQALNRFAELHLMTNEVEQAHTALNRVLLIVRDIGDRIGEAHALCRLGVVRQRTGRLDNAETTLQHALSIAEQVGQRVVAGMAHHSLGTIALARGHLAAGANHVDAAYALFTELDSTIWRAKSLILRSDIHQARGEEQLAARDLEQAITLLGKVHSVEATRLREELERTYGSAIFR
ncbi:AfsR/SARP family transcriptional regulator [Actinophytocola gossypii]|uniref:Winged helix-turn-helix domain-containing protein n=1 Tax=Actinophytocola gossypii TaxID=2812003 RepID=A0ABT2J7B0_9PSEU|nr:BTAD domain-containing putative transcriptional regulator [Actinophytocola gossypii]MCT2583742.1 winged helix-turn-helix domain-containing protein [Actinophytocola gossypii]